MNQLNLLISLENPLEEYIVYFTKNRVVWKGKHFVVNAVQPYVGNPVWTLDVRQRGEKRAGHSFTVRDNVAAELQQLLNEYIKADEPA